MMLAGAEGETRQQLVKLLRLPKEYASKPQQPASSDQQKSTSLANRPSPGSSISDSKTNQFSAEELRHREFLMLTEQVLHGNHDFVHLASFIYLDKAFKRVERYKQILRDFYETKPKKIDFGDLDNLTKTVNEDVARTTENIYSDILSKQEAAKFEKSMFLVSAVFFRGFWLSNFTEVIDDGSFYKPHPRGQPVSIKMMSKIDYLKTHKDKQLDARILTMPFEASDLQMMLILPNNRQSDSTYLCEKVTASKLEQIAQEINKAKFKTTKVSMPIFCVDSGKISIQSTLVQMGAGDLFDRNSANMMGVSENKPLWLNKILHRCFIICDNRGAITSSAFEKARRRQAKLLSATGQSKGELEEFCFDHAFMYIIMDSVTGTILLMGLYTDPKETLEVVHESQLSSEEAHHILTEGVYKT